MEIVWFLIIGAVAGWLAGRLLKGISFGILGNIVIGAIGAIIGQFVFRKLGIYIGIDYRIDALIMACVGSIILLICLGLIKRLK